MSCVGPSGVELGARISSVCCSLMVKRSPLLRWKMRCCILEGVGGEWAGEPNRRVCADREMALATALLSLTGSGDGLLLTSNLLRGTLRCGFLRGACCVNDFAFFTDCWSSALLGMMRRLRRLPIEL